MLKPSKFTFNNYEYSTINFFIFSLLTYFIIYDYKFYGIAFSIIILIFGFQFNTNKIENNIYKILTLVFYFKKFYLGLSTSSKTDWAKSFFGFYDDKYPDFNNVLYQIKCNFEGDNFFKSSKEIQCPAIDGYGPLIYLIRFDINLDLFLNICLLILFSLLIITYFKLISNFSSWIPIISILFMSPVVNLIIHQFNIDIFIIYAAIFASFNIDKNIFLKAILVSSFSLIKIHSLGFIIGIVIFSYAKKNKKVFYTYFFSIIFVLGWTFYDVFFLKSLTNSQRPSGLYNASGLLTLSQNIWINYLSFFGQYRDVLIIYLTLIILISGLIYLLRSKYFQISFIRDKEINFLTISSIFWLFSVYLYANYDYRNTILLLLTPLLFDNKNKFKSKVIFIFILISPLPTDINFNILNLFTFLKASCFIYIFSIIIYDILYFISETFKLKKLRKILN